MLTNTFKLNFVPEANRLSLRKMLILLTLRKVFTLLFLLLIIFSATLFASGLLMDSLKNQVQDQRNDIDVRIDSENEEQSIDDAIHTLNQVTGRLFSIQAGYVYWTSVLDRMSEILPQDIQLNSLSFDVGSSSVSISGSAKTRDSYLALEQALSTSSYITSADLPISLEKENIPFSLDIKLEKAFFTFTDEN